MQILETIQDYNEVSETIVRSLGLVTTMGAIHDGHLSLMRRSIEDNMETLVTIFVNPMQFSPGDDYERYPRTIKSDIDKLNREGVDYLFRPSVEEMYPEGFDTLIKVGRIGQVLEGSSRIGHFEGVATIVSKIFSIIRPDRAYFGQKDAQQIRIIKRVNEDLNFGVEVIECPTVREVDGLAMSSRNTYLSSKQKHAAKVIYQALSLARTVGNDASQIKGVVSDLIDKEPLATLDYISVADAETLEEINFIESPALVSLAVFIDDMRLIDNILLK